MRRRRSLPWIHRWSRPIIGAIAIVGAILTAYLTYAKLTGQAVACRADAALSSTGCNDVLSSAYANIFGLPLSLFGALAYVSMAGFAFAPLLVSGEGSKRLRNQLESGTWLLLLAGGTAMAVFSGYLMYILAAELQTSCPYCIASALFSLSFLILTIIGREWDDFGQLLFTGIMVATVTLVGTLGVYANVNAPPLQAGGATVISAPTSAPTPPLGWAITTVSGNAELKLAEHLRTIGAKKYGAFWCPHCYEQKQLFGKQAFAKVNYIECADAGKHPQPGVCQAAEIKSFPTWEIDGELHAGTQELDQLAKLSNYEGPMDFQYTLKGR